MSAPTGSAHRFGCYVGNIDSSVSIDMLKQVFCSCGTILDASLNGRTEDPYRFGFIDFATDEARACALKYNGYTLVGRKLRVNISKGNVGKPEGFGNPSPRESGRDRHNDYGQQPQQYSQYPPAQYGLHGTTAAAAGPAPPSAAGNGSGLSAADQQQAQLLLQLIQQGAVDPQNLTEAQRTLLVTALSTGAADGAPAPAAAAAPAAAPAVPQAAQAGIPPPQAGGLPPPPMGMYNPMWGMAPGPYGGPMPYGNPMMMGNMYGGPQQGHVPHGHHQRHQRAPANPSPSEELMKLREMQLKQFVKVVTEETEAYERKYVGKAKEEGGKSGDDSSGSEDDEGAKSEQPAEKRTRADSPA